MAVFFIKANQKLSFLLVFAITLAGNYVESVTPAVKLGGEAAKVYLFRKHSGLDYDRLTGILLALKYYSILPFMCLALFFAGFALINFDLPRLALAALAFLILFFAVVALIYYKAGSNSAHNQEHATPEIWLAGTETYNNMNLIGKVLLTFKKRLAKIILLLTRAGIFARSMTNRLERFALISLSTLVWLTYPVKVLLFARMLGLDIGLFSIAVITFTAYLISMVPLLPGGLGSYEATMALMFTLYGFTPAEGITVALCDRQEKCDPLAGKKLIHQRQEKSDPLRALRWKKSDPPLPMATPLPSAIGTRA